MTEEQWLGSTDPEEMFLLLRDSGQASARKARLFIAACCRRCWGLLTDVRGQRAVNVAA